MISSRGAANLVDEFLLNLAIAAVDAARAGVLGLLHSFGASTEPDFASIAGVYDRMLATAWSPDLQAIADKLGAVAHAKIPVSAGPGVPLGSVISLILIALLMDFLAIVVFLELVVRAALTLILTAFIPIVCAMAIWPRMAGAITHLGEFLVGLLLSKFVIATVAYVGFGLVVGGLSGAQAPSGQQDWIITGVAVLCIAAFSPVVLVQGLRFTHSTAGSVARGWVGGAVGLSQSALGTAALGTRAVGGVTSGLGRRTKARRKGVAAR